MGVVETHYLHEYLNASCAGICPNLVMLDPWRSHSQMVLTVLYSLHKPISHSLLLRLQNTLNFCLPDMLLMVLNEAVLSVSIGSSSCT